MNKLKYVPIMSPKKGELEAIKELSKEALTTFTPLFDVHRITIKGGKKDKTLNQHLDTIIKSFEKYWQEEKLFLLDYSLVDLSLRMDDGSHPVAYISDKLNDRNMKFILTIGLDRDQSYLDAIKGFLLKTPNKIVCFRLLEEDFYNIQETKEEIGRILSCLEMDFDKCYLLIDFKYIEQRQIDDKIGLLSELNQFLPFEQWKSFVLIASGFPESISGVPRNSNGSIRRTELDLWQAAIEASPLIGGKPGFGDYVIVNPERPEIDSITMRPGGKIRYTTENTWEIFRGHNLQTGERYQQYYSLAKIAINSKYYLGMDYSWGDRYLEQCAKKQVKTGNLTTWVKVDKSSPHFGWCTNRQF